MVDSPDIEYSQPLERQENQDQAIHLYDVLWLTWLEEYFRKLTWIKRDQLQTLPSWNTFIVTHEGIVFTRNGKEELWIIRATNKSAGLHIDWLEHSSAWWKVRITARKLWINFKQEEPQILPWEEIAGIFTAIELGKPYTRPQIRPDGKPYELILEVTRK